MRTEKRPGYKYNNHINKDRGQNPCQNGTADIHLSIHNPSVRRFCRTRGSGFTDRRRTFGRNSQTSQDGRAQRKPARNVRYERTVLRTVRYACHRDFLCNGSYQRGRVLLLRYRSVLLLGCRCTWNIEAVRDRAGCL